MSDSHKKIVVVKLDEETKPLMKEYIVSDQPQQPEIKPLATPKQTRLDKPRAKHTTVRFDELSFASLSKHSASVLDTPSPQMNMSLLAASKEVKPEEPKPKPKPQLETRPEPIVRSYETVKSRQRPRPNPIRSPLQSSYPRKKLVKQKRLRFENKEEDGYKIGFLPSFSHEELRRPKLPRQPHSLSKMERLLDIKATVSGRNK